MESIRLFVDLVRDTWGTLLSVDSCLSRPQRKIVRNVIRDYMISLPPVSNSADMPVQWLLEKHRLRNPYYYYLTTHDSGYLEHCRLAVPQLYAVDTVGQYLVFMVFSILRVEFLHIASSTSELGNLSESSAASDWEQVMTGALFKLLQFGAYLNNTHRCTYMFVGAPMYWLNRIDWYQAYHDIQNHVNLSTESKMYVAYFEYLRLTDRREPYDGKSVTLEFCGETWSFDKSAPEFIMEALCYSVHDTIIKHDDSVVRLYLTEAQNAVSGDAETYYYELDSTFRETRYGGFPIPVDTVHEISAIWVADKTLQPKGRDMYFARYKLVTPSTCGTQLVMLETREAVGDDGIADRRVRDAEPEPEPDDKARAESPLWLGNDQGGMSRPASEPPRIPSDEEGGVTGLLGLPVPSDESALPFEDMYTWRGSRPGPDAFPEPGSRPPIYIAGNVNWHALPWDTRLQIAETQMDLITDKIMTVATSCFRNWRLAARIGHHVETMRQYCVMLARKTNIQTGFPAGVLPQPHMLTHSLPPGIQTSVPSLPKEMFSEASAPKSGAAYAPDISYENYAAWLSQFESVVRGKHDALSGLSESTRFATYLRDAK